MVYKKQISHTDGWSIFQFKGCKLFVDFWDNKRDFKIEAGLAEYSREWLDRIFTVKLGGIKQLLEEMGINYLALSKKDRNLCGYTIAEIRTKTHHGIFFRVKGHIKPDRLRAIDIKESFDFGDGVKLGFERDKLNMDKFLMTIDFDEG